VRGPADPAWSRLCSACHNDLADGVHHGHGRNEIDRRQALADRTDEDRKRVGVWTR